MSGEGAPVVGCVDSIVVVVVWSDEVVVPSGVVLG